MSPEKPTPQHDDEPTAESVIAKAINYRIDGGEILSFENIGAPMAVGIMAALKAAGFEITKRTELGVTKGLPGLGNELTRMTQRMSAFAGQEAGKNFAGAFELGPDAIQEELARADMNRTGHVAVNPDLPNAAEWMRQLLDDLARRRDQPALEIALDVIGRRTDIVAVKLPEPLRERIWPIVIGGETETVWLNPAANEDLIVVSGTCTLDATEARNLAAALLAAAARADAAEGEAK